MLPVQWLMVTGPAACFQTNRDEVIDFPQLQLLCSHHSLKTFSMTADVTAAPGARQRLAPCKITYFNIRCKKCVRNTCFLVLFVYYLKYVSVILNSMMYFVFLIGGPVLWGTPSSHISKRWWSRHFTVRRYFTGISSREQYRNIKTTLRCPWERKLVV